MQAVCELVMQILGLSNADFVTTVYANVVGVAPSVQDQDYFVGLLQGSGGTITQAELLVLAANAGVNEQNINLVGLQQSGVEFVWRLLDFLKLRRHSAWYSASAGDWLPQ